MKRILILFILVASKFTFSQNVMSDNSYIDFNYFTGNIALHNNDILHLIKGHPEGFIFSWNKKTFGDEQWHSAFNYPDYGASFIYQDLKNSVLGENYGIYAHYNFYFFKRNLMFRIGQGLAYNTNPYDKYTNPKNIALGTHFLSSTYAMLNYKKEHLFGQFGMQAGVSLIHYSNANVKAPNTSVNTTAINFGVNYNLDEERLDYVMSSESEKFTEPIKYNLAFRSGINQSDIIGTGQFPFYIFSGYADKRLNKRSAIQLGTDVFFSNFLKQHIRYKAAAQLDGVTGDEDFKRIGVFAGHELFINKTSVETQLGYYVYYPFDFEGRTYIRVGLKRYFNDKLFGALTLKSHGAKAEAMELGIGVRL